MANIVPGDDIQHVVDTLNHPDVIEYQLTAEVLWSAMLYLKRHPEESLCEALNHGFDEWIK